MEMIDWSFIIVRFVPFLSLRVVVVSRCFSVKKKHLWVIISLELAPFHMFSSLKDCDMKWLPKRDINFFNGALKISTHIWLGYVWYRLTRDTNVPRSVSLLNFTLYGLSQPPTFCSPPLPLLTRDTNYVVLS